MIWVYDYYFFLFGKVLCDEGVESFLGFFLYIFFFVLEIFKILFEYVCLVCVMILFDFVGF